MTMKNKRKKGRHGASRMIDLGYKPVQLWLSPETHQSLRILADNDQRPMTKYVSLLIHAAIREASKKGK